MKVIDMKAERDRIARLLTDQLKTRISEVSHLGGEVLPSPAALAAVGIGSVTLCAADAATILEIFERLDKVHKQGVEALEDFLRENRRIGDAEYAYQNPRLKKTSEKMAAAVKSLGIKAKPGNRDFDMYESYLRFAPFKNTAAKVEAITLIAERDNKTKRGTTITTYAAVLQAIKREISRRRANCEAVPETAPRTA